MSGSEFDPRAKKVEGHERCSDSTIRRKPESWAGRRPTLVVGHGADVAERDADRIADSVLARLRAGDADQPGEYAQDAHVQRSATGGAGSGAVVGYDGGPLPDHVSDRIEMARAGGSPLPGRVRARMEGAFGLNLGSVRIHHDAQAAQLNRMVSARAFTTGRDIFFGDGQYRPDTSAGEHVLAHELAHTTQHSDVRRISRLWDLKSKKKLPIGMANSVRTLKSRPIWFVSDRSGDEIVIKPEDQPTGLSDLVSGMHRKIAKVKSVQQRKLDKSEVYSLDNMINVYGYPGTEHTWHVRGEFLSDNPGQQAQAQPETADNEEPATIAQDDALARLKTKGNNIVAMSVAEGEDAMAASAPDPSADGASSAVSRMRRMLEDRDHVRLLGQLNMVDLFMGNLDRLMSGNMGNWFYNPQGAITLIDHIDPGDNAGAEMTGGMLDNQKWTDRITMMYLGSPANRRAAAAEVRFKLQQTMGRDSDDGGAGDTNVRAWFNTQVNGKTRAAQIEESLVEGMGEAKARILKIFTAKKVRFFKPKTWGASNRKAASKQRSIRHAADKASAADTGDERYDGAGQPDYFGILQARATYLAGCR